MFNQEMGVPAAGHLEFFLKQFRKELDEFVAEFECVPRQIGAIILVDDQVVGIERAPSHAYWQSVWPCLIRECYGSLAIRVAQLKGERAPEGAKELGDPGAGRKASHSNRLSNSTRIEHVKERGGSAVGQSKCSLAGRLLMKS